MRRNAEKPNVLEAIHGAQPLLRVFLQHPGDQRMQQHAEVLELLRKLQLFVDDVADGF